MPKTVTIIENNPVATANRLRDAVHIVTQKKGGVGKSTVARILAEYLKQVHGQCHCFDTDPSQPTFQRVGGLNVKRVQLLTNDEIDPMLINPMLETIIGENGPFVIDTGSSSYHSLWSYIMGAELFELLGAKDRPVVIHVPLAPKPDLEDTLIGFDEIAQHSPARSVVVWLNQRETPIEIPGGQDFTDLEVAVRNADKLLALIVASRQKHRWNRQYVGEMIEKRQTFQEAIEGQSTITRSYLQRVREEIFTQLQEAGL
jgi:ABC-type dipeptide/oligopeptide/nickel transport system ATPase subunit